MPPRAPAPGTPEEWLVFAKSSLALARQPKPEDALWEDYCFLAHQAVEKDLKAVYQKRGFFFKFTHDIGELGVGLEKGGLRIPPEIREAFDLTKYVYETRYPGPTETVTESEFRRVLAIAETVMKWSERIVKSSEDFGSPMARNTQRFTPRTTKTKLNRK